MLYKFRVDRGVPPKQLDWAVNQLLSGLAGPSATNSISFRLIAHNAI